MYFTIYKITHIDSGKTYIGAHKTRDLNDGYMGSGTRLKRAQAKYGLDRFSKEILYIFDNKEEMFAKEAELVNEEFVKRADTYNLKEGGFGGFDYLNDKDRFDNPAHSPERMREFVKIGNAACSLECRQNSGRKNGLRAKMLGIGIFYPGNRGSFKGMKHSEDSKRKIGSKTSVSQKGSGNSQYGTMWITDGVTSRKVDSDIVIPEGWRRGRVMPKSTL